MDTLQHALLQAIKDLEVKLDTKIDALEHRLDQRREKKTHLKGK